MYSRNFFWQQLRIVRRLPHDANFFIIFSSSFYFSSCLCTCTHHCLSCNELETTAQQRQATTDSRNRNVRSPEHRIGLNLFLTASAEFYLDANRQHLGSFHSSLIGGHSLLWFVVFVGHRLPRNVTTLRQHRDRWSERIGRQVEECDQQMMRRRIAICWVLMRKCCRL